MVYLICFKGASREFFRAQFLQGANDMPKVKLTQSFLLSVKPDASLKGVWYSDSVTCGLQLYVEAGGKKTW